MQVGLPSSVLFLSVVLLWAACSVSAAIIIGTTSYPSSRRSEKCARKVAEAKPKSPWRAMSRCMATYTTMIAVTSGDIIIVGTKPVPDDRLTMWCLSQLQGKNISMPGWLVEKCRNRPWTTIGSPMVETNGPTFISKHENDEVLLSCIVREKGEHDVMWMRFWPSTMLIFLNTQRYHKDGRYSIETDGNSTFNMRIVRIRQEDEGVYACQVNTFPSPTLVNITLQVVVAPKIVGFTAESGVVPVVNDAIRFTCNESDDVILTCDAQGSPKPFVTWERVIFGERMSINSTLRIPNIRRDQGGYFRCSADNGYPEKAEERLIEIIVQFKPEVEAEENDIRCGEGDYQQLKCHIDSVPQATYRWVKDGEVLSGTGAIENKPKTTTFVLISARPERDYGVYRCQATNLLGTSEAVIEISGRLRAPKVVSASVGIRRHLYKMQWVLGTRLQKGMAGYTPIGGYIITYNGWWFQENELGVLEKVFSHRQDAPLTENVTHNSDLIRQSFVFRDLKANSTYDVTIRGYNKYGYGDIALFTFYTSLVNTWETTIQTPKETAAALGHVVRWRNSKSSLHKSGTGTVVLAVLVWFLVRSA